MMGPIVNGGLIDFHDAAVMQAMAYPQPGQFPQPGPYLASGVPQSGQYLAGPPSFLHLNGQVYKPVPASEVECAPEPKKEAKVPKTATDKDIERRVAAKVEEFMSKSTKSTRTARAKPAESDSDRLKELNNAMRRSLRSRS